MKIVMPIMKMDESKPLIEQIISQRFGRAAYFVIVDTDTDHIEAIENSNINAEHGAGIGAAQLVVDQGGKAVLSGRLGPKASSVLKSANISCYEVEEVTVSEGVKKLLANELESIG